MTELGEVPSSGGSDLPDSEARGSMVGFVLAMAVCLILVVTVVLVLVVQPGKKSAPTNQSGSLCWDTAMQMEMPCAPGTP